MNSCLLRDFLMVDRITQHILFRYQWKKTAFWHQRGQYKASHKAQAQTYS